MNQSPFTGQQQTFVWPAQWWEVTVELPAMTDASAGEWRAFFLACNGREGTFYFGDSVRKVPRGTIAGSVTVGSGSVSNSTTLPLAGGTGVFAVGDWLQVGTTTAARLHQATKINSGDGTIDVFPRLRSAYANGTAIDYTSPVGLFRLQDMPSWMFDEAKIAQGVTFSAMEVLT
jgi:hypothetical protein